VGVESQIYVIDAYNHNLLFSRNKHGTESSAAPPPVCLPCCS
jgi:hypothetical protein